MKFNRFVWQVYRQSERGKKALRRFARLTDRFIEPDLRKYAFTFFDEFKDQYPAESVLIDIAKLIRDSVAGTTFRNWKQASGHYRRVMVRKGVPFEMADKRGRKDVVFIFGKADEDWYDYVAAVTLGLYWAQPEFFLPYNFRTRFNQLEEIHSEFDIPLPPLPGKLDKVGRSHYYLAINASWLEFRGRYGFSPAEMCAFLYDFAPQFTTPIDASDLPAPSKAWLTVGGAWDIDTVDGATADTVQHWGGNSAVRRGDILLMYLVSPRGFIDSIWRSCSDGFIHPFFHYHSVVWLCTPVRTKPVTLAELKRHPLLSRKERSRRLFRAQAAKRPSPSRSTKQSWKS